ncbi:MAG: tRNA uridine-5-carboxymethylaminomethyl(34) synthesis enzyme MnmG [Anaerovoracaceae bacterium]|nr:tRNA uridine-5-carboxymethylaminomethyl(34) synthesis enzyme MnmG [Bacillota bacterium]MDY2670760.1 tRNA uridine-5-carboxymethylaminomethyl(34) synthesis enzyme MnmG [Anaerovoracaceae bacterium]
MDLYEMGNYDVIVVGAGHAGCEAALAPARMGLKTLMLSITLEAVAMMPCNPSIGGTGKGHLVREIDALGGEMGVNIDKTFLQSRMLNTAKGPAVHSLRAQADKRRYHEEMKKTIERTPNLDLKQAEVVDIIVEDGRVGGIVTRTGAVYRSRTVIIATGTFLAGKIFIGESSFMSGPNGMAPSLQLSENLKKHGIPLRRFKTGTPARVKASSIDYSRMQVQHGDEPTVPFSFMNESPGENQIDCWLTYTNEKTHEIIRDNFERSALFTGEIVGTGPRYCPSIETKIARFPDRKRHQLFIEPEGLSTEEMYIQGMSSSLPEDVQRDFYHSIAGLEKAEIMRPAYAIEYDCINPLDLKTSLESRIIENLFFAGQTNGSSGYEEAAAQGIMAGINAAQKVKGEEPFVLDRSEAYIGVLIDDLVTKGTNEPYRMMTSRAEYRLTLRQDNACDRLTEKSYKIGLATEERYQRWLQIKSDTEKEMKRLKDTKIKPEIVNPFLASLGSAEVNESVSLAELLRRPEVNYDNLAEIDTDRPDISYHSKVQAAVNIKYEGYIKKQMRQIEKFKRLENRKIPADIDYMSLEGIRNEAKEKLEARRPDSVGQASRISGVSPADINVLLIYLERMKYAGKSSENSGDNSDE